MAGDAGYAVATHLNCSIKEVLEEHGSPPISLGEVIGTLCLGKVAMRMWLEQMR